LGNDDTELDSNETMFAAFAASFSGVTVHRNLSPRPALSTVPDASSRKPSQFPIDCGPDSDTIGATGLSGPLTETHCSAVVARLPVTAVMTPLRSTSVLLGTTPGHGCETILELAGSISEVLSELPIKIWRPVGKTQVHMAPKPKLLFRKTDVQLTAPAEPKRVPLLAHVNVTRMLRPLADISADAMFGGDLRGTITALLCLMKEFTPARFTIPPENQRVSDPNTRLS
jgi:hypothetical protein